MFNFIQGIFCGVTGGLEVTFGGVHDLVGHTVEQFRAPLFKHREQFFFDEGANRLDTEFVFTRLGKRAPYKLLDEQAMHFTAAQEALGGANDAVHQGLIGFGVVLGEFELPVQMATLLARCMQAGHHALGERVDRHLRNPLRQAFEPVSSVVLQGGLHGFTFHSMTTVVAMANAIGTLDCGETHTKHEMFLSISHTSGFRPRSSTILRISR